MRPAAPYQREWRYVREATGRHLPNGRRRSGKARQGCGAADPHRTDTGPCHRTRRTETARAGAGRRHHTFTGNRLRRGRRLRIDRGLDLHARTRDARDRDSGTSRAGASRADPQATRSGASAKADSRPRIVTGRDGVRELRLASRKDRATAKKSLRNNRLRQYFGGADPAFRTPDYSR